MNYVITDARAILLPRPICSIAFNLHSTILNLNVILVGFLLSRFEMNSSVCSITSEARRTLDT